MSADAALAAILLGSGFRAQADSSGAFAIVRTDIAASSSGPAAGPSNLPSSTTTQMSDGDPENVPEILIIGRRNWSLNTGIERTRDDAQPFIVLDREEIRRSGSPNIEQFLRDFLNVNSQQFTTEQTGLQSPTVGLRDRQQGQSGVNLRGLGERDTLILIDGRRQPGLNTGNGNLEQPAITNIPLSSIERIEVLASSASGIYGAGASGGVINIILRRDYNGGQISATYADTRDTKAADRRIDMNVGKSLEGGRSNISLSASYRDVDPLLFREREAYLSRALRSALQNNPGFFNFRPPLGATPNVGARPPGPLTIDPALGGGVINSGNFFVPPGFRGVALDGIAPLLANAGQFNFDFADTAALGGARAPILLGSKTYGGSVALRREMNSWLRVYAEVAGSRAELTRAFSLAPTQFQLEGDAPNNPFMELITVTTSLPGYEAELRSRNDQLRFVGGAIASLPYGWQAILDASYSRNRFKSARLLETIPRDEFDLIGDGTFDILRDPALFDFELRTIPLITPDNSFGSTSRTATFKLAGPVPIALPGGRPTVVLNLEQNRDDFGDAVTTDDDGLNFIGVSYTPKRHQTLSSAYGEIRLPLIGDANDIPLVQGFEVTFAGRYEHYKGVGSGQGFRCFTSFTGLPPGEDINAVIARTCDADTLNLPRGSASDAHFDPSVSAKWTVLPDLSFRASYATGYVPSRLNELIQAPDRFFIAVGDPERGGETIGTPLGFLNFGEVSGIIGGNPNLLPETSKTLTLGVILTPRFMPGLRFSADYTNLRKRNVYANPQLLLINFEAADGGAADFANFLRFFPERITRGPPSGGFAVGPITSIDASLVNLNSYRFKGIDFALDYTTAFAGGTLDFAATATRNILLSFKTFEDVPAVDSTGVVPISNFANPPFVSGDIKWKGNAQIRYSDDEASFGIRGRYTGGYFLNIDRSVELTSGTNRIRSQFYIDVFGSYQIARGFLLRGGMNNLLNTSPPIVNAAYSGFGDVRGANFYLTLAKDF